MMPRIFRNGWLELARASWRECSLAMDDFRELCRRFSEEEKGIKRGVDGRVLGWGPVDGDELVESPGFWAVKCYSCGLRYSFEAHSLETGNPNLSGFSYAQYHLRRLGWFRRSYESHSKRTHFSCPECSNRGDS